MDRNAKIALGILAAAIVFHDIKLREVIKTSNTNVRVMENMTEAFNQAVTDMQFVDIVNQFEED